MLKIQFINWWSNGKDDFFKKFIENYMKIETVVVDHQPDILFFSVFHKISPHQYVKNNPSVKLKIFFTGEDTTSGYSRGCGSDHYYLNFADISLGFKNLDHPNYIRFPLWLTYINIEKYNMGKPCLPFQKIANFKPNNQGKFCCIISNHDSNNTRTNIVQSLSNYEIISVAGNIKNNFKNIAKIHNISAGKNEYNKQLCLNGFKFNICSESSISPGYISEKLFECIIGGCIPIYYCNHDVDIESEIINNNFIIKYNNNNVETVAKKILEINNNKKLYDEFVNQNILNNNAYDNIISYYDKLKIKILEKLN
tara:strand:+ start:302 stop:1231 length:930 start_codon:yes stop_codon:yes gene_type:complete